MTIKILPARLANQIAAGEVVERPASVVKELLENSLDSGASRIDIDIEKGGSKLIRVRDNGKGIKKEELALALSRHATSKIHTLDDLEAITSLGFRGEALASISSVSRLTLTSRTAAQEQAWSAYSEGRDMEVKTQPTAHPVGTTVEVLDLFFNTPARRKFLRTDKTEFSHIDELLKRIALSRFDVTINLKHNGKVVRQYRAAQNDIQREKRIAAVCGAAFVRHMLNIELEHNGLRLHGWITSPEGARQQGDLQFCYVNGRMMRDKLINHAIRQSYENSLRPEQFASYVLYIELDPAQVDVNVHPAKHEVRFHQARLVHDFIYQVLADALSQSHHVEAKARPDSAHGIPLNRESLNKEPSKHDSPHNEVVSRAMEAMINTPAYPGRTDYEARSATTASKGENVIREVAGATDWVQTARTEQSNQKHSDQKYNNQAVERAARKQHDNPVAGEVKAYRELLTTEDAEPLLVVEQTPPRVDQTTATERVKITSLGKAYSVIKNHFLLTQSDVGEVLISLKKAEWYRITGQLQVEKCNLTAQPLLVPLSIKVDAAEIRVAQQYQALLQRFAIQLKEKNKTLMVMAVPSPLRQKNLQQLIPELLSYLTLQQSLVDAESIRHWLANEITEVKSVYSLSEGIQLISELEQLWEGRLPLHDTTFIQAVSFDTTIARFAK